jgi:hypothetical protein
MLVILIGQHFRRIGLLGGQTIRHQKKHSDETHATSESFHISNVLVYSDVKVRTLDNTKLKSRDFGVLLDSRSGCGSRRVPDGSLKLYQITIFPVMPNISVTYAFK